VVRDVITALEVSKRLGARAVTMTGLIPSATDTGRAVVRAVAAKHLGGMPALTTGHATTCAAVVLSVERVLKACARELNAERVAFVGLGSIGVGVLRAMLACMPHPRELVLCDVYGRADQLRELQEEVVSASRFRGTVHVAPGRGEVSPAVYGASLVVGATNVPDVLDVGRLRPGTIIVDDSAPHCFPVTTAIARFEASADVLFSEGGMLDVPERIRETAYYPAEMGDSESLAKLISYLCHDATSITGCVFSGLLTARYGFRPTIGSPSTQDVLDHVAALRKLGFTGGRLRCNGYFPTPDRVMRFRAAFGRR
jgi:predicted amino acid dehydrogenase